MKYTKQIMLAVSLLLTAVVITGCTTVTTPPVKDNDATTQNQPEAIAPAPVVVDNNISTPVQPEPVAPSVKATAEQDQPSAVKEFTMTVKKWEFNPATITVNKGDTVRLKIKSLDVNHGIALPDFNVNVEVGPQQTKVVEFVADKTGSFTFFCSVFCGSGHSGMTGRLIVK